MPFLKMTLSQDVTEEARSALLAEGSELVAEALGKPERYVMVTVDQAPILFAGETGPAAFVELRSIGGLGPETNGTLSGRLCDLLERRAGIAKERTFLNFVDVGRSDWGHAGKTF